MTTLASSAPAGRRPRRTGGPRVGRPLAVALIALGLWAAAAPRPALGAAPSLVVADVQVRELTAERQYVVQVRSTAAQPFDVLATPPGVVHVRLHGAQLGGVAAVTPADFGSITLSEEVGVGAVLLRVDLADPAYRVRVTQGGNPNAVELRISR